MFKSSYRVLIPAPALPWLQNIGTDPRVITKLNICYPIFNIYSVSTKFATFPSSSNPLTFILVPVLKCYLLEIRMTSTGLSAIFS